MKRAVAIQSLQSISFVLSFSRVGSRYSRICKLQSIKINQNQNPSSFQGKRIIAAKDPISAQRRVAFRALPMQHPHRDQCHGGSRAQPETVTNVTISSLRTALSRANTCQCQPSFCPQRLPCLGASLQNAHQKALRSADSPDFVRLRS